MKKGFDKVLKSKMLAAISKAAYFEAVKTANSACVFWAYQSRIPSSVKKLRKF